MAITDARFLYYGAVKETIRNNGGTFTYDGGITIQTRGYMVGGRIPTRCELWTGNLEALAFSLFDYVRSNADTFSLRDVRLGTWLNEGIVYIDASEWVPDRDAALALGRSRGELAIWDCYHGNEINTEVG